MSTATQYDIFGGERAADPTGRRRSLAEHTERCNLCCIPFDNAELPHVGHFFYLGFHICERCHTAFTEAEEDKRNGRKIVRWREIEFFISRGRGTSEVAPADAISAGNTVAIAIDGAIAGFIGKAAHLAHWIGRGPRGLPYKRIDDEGIIEQLLNVATDAGLVTDCALAHASYRFDNMIAEIYDNIGYKRLNFSDIEG